MAQADLGIEVIDRILTRDFLESIGMEEYGRSVEGVVRFLRGADSTLAGRIANRGLLPEGHRFEQLADTEWAFGTAGTEDKARYYATLYIEEIADGIRERVDERFDLVRYGEHLTNYAPTFDELESALRQEPTRIDELMLSLLEEYMEQERPEVVGIAIPFPGCVYGGLRCGQWLKRTKDGVTVVIGGGFANTEWRQLEERRLFDYCDYVTLDDGELPLERIIEQKGRGEKDEGRLVRTYWRDEGGSVRYSGNDEEQVSYPTLLAPDYGGIKWEKYLSLSEMANPMHRMWSSGRWNKLMVAHGCYWHRCAFCDTTLDYIKRYEAPTAKTVVDKMEREMEQSGSSGFHFVDEALPPQLLREVSEEIIRRKLTVSYWGNIRFEKAYTKEMCTVMAEAGCIAVSGGLEVASDRLLKLMDKGVTIEQTVEACRHFRDAGIMVHTYLMYGFPSETLEETLNALEVVRRMFAEGIVQSAFWHRYAMTCHSRSGREPERYGARRKEWEAHPFCNNEVEWEEHFDYDIEEIGRGLRFATYNYMNEIGLEIPVEEWFHIKKSKKKRGKSKV